MSEAPATPARDPVTPRIDAHLHVWDLTAGGYDWLTPEHGPLHASFSPGEAREQLSAAGVTAAVLVQADDTERDTERMLAVADAHPWVAGVVGWVQLDRPEVTEAQLDRWQAHRRFCGVRHLLHADPRPDLLQRPEVRRSLGVVARRGLAFDVPDAWPGHLLAARDVAAAVPGLRVVVDHLGKPPADPDQLHAWRTALAAVAEQPGTVAKLSGLQDARRPVTAAALRPLWEVALELFGPERLMYGGDWPMTVPYGGYARSWAVAAELLAELSPDEQHRVLSGTAVDVYGLDTPGMPGSVTDG